MRKKDDEIEAATDELVSWVEEMAEILHPEKVTQDNGPKHGESDAT